MGAEKAGDRELRYTGLYMFSRFCITFIKTLARQIEIKNQRAERLLAAMRIFIMLNVPSTKRQRNTWPVLSSFFSKLYQN